MRCINWRAGGHDVVIGIKSAVDNRGEDLRFPISSSSGFSSPMIGRLERGARIKACQDFLAGFCSYLIKNEQDKT